MELENMKVNTDGLMEIIGDDEDEIINFWDDEGNEDEVSIEGLEGFDDIDGIGIEDEIEDDEIEDGDIIDEIEDDEIEDDASSDTLENREKEGLGDSISKGIGIDDREGIEEEWLEDRSEMVPDEAGEGLALGVVGIDGEGVRIESEGFEREIEGYGNLPSEIKVGDGEEDGAGSLIDGAEESVEDSIEDSIEESIEDVENPAEQEESEEIAEESEERAEESEERADVVIENDFLGEDGSILLQSKDESSHDRFKLEYIDITKIAVVKRVRLTKGVEDLLESIKSTGLLNPIVVAPTATDGVYVLINGYRRLIACAKLGIKEIPSIVNTKIETKDIPVLETMYNRYKPYTMQEIVKCIEYLRNEKGIQSTSMIEYLLQLDSGDCSKLQDIIEDDDADIVDPLLNGEMSIAQAFKKLEQRRKKESKEEKEIKQASKVYTESEEQALEDIKDTGEEAHEENALTDEEIESLAISNEEIAESENESLDGMVEQGKEIQGFEDHKQDYKHREHLDPALRKAVLARDDNTCMCCGLKGQEYIGVFDVHHKVEVYLGGDDSIDNLITVCTVCHRLIHSYGRGELYIRPESQLSEEEKIKFKKIVKLGNKIREGMALKGMKKEKLKELDNMDKIGRTKPGTPIQQAT